MEQKTHPKCIFIPNILIHPISEVEWEESGIDGLEEKFCPPVSPDPITEPELYMCYLAMMGWATECQHAVLMR